MTNPYESPKTPAGSNEPPGITGVAVGSFVLGGLLCAVGTFAVAALVGLVVTAGSRGPYSGVTGLVVFLNAPGVIGPICGGIIWAIARKRRRAFGIGAVAFGVAAFLFVGGCMTLMRFG